MRNGILGGFMGVLLACAVLIACGGSGGPAPLAATFGQFTIPGSALDIDPLNATFERDSQGLRWAFSGVGAARIAVPRPPNYAGGDVTVRMLILKEFAGAGTLNFFVRAASHNLEEARGGVTGVLGTEIDITGTPTTAYVEVVMTVPASRLTESYWDFPIQREALVATYTQDVVVRSITFQYTPST